MLEAARCLVLWSTVVVLVLFVGTLFGARGASADASLVLQLRTSLVPVTEAYSVRSWIELSDGLDQGGVSEHYAILVTDDLATGKRVAQFDISATDEVGTIPVNGTMELFGPGDVFLGSRPYAVELQNKEVFVLTVLIEPECLPFATCISSPFYSCVRTFYTSEEEPPSLCPPGSAASSLSCLGDDCDNVKLGCTPVSGGLGPERWTEFFSDESPLFHGCAGTELITGIECSGSYCDDIRLRCQAANASLSGCSATPPVSDDLNNPYVADPDHFLRRIRCSGDHCDNKELQVCGIRERVFTLNRCVSRCISVSGFNGGPVVTGSGLELGACRSAAADANLDQRWQLSLDEQIINPDLDLCLAPGFQGEPPSVQKCIPNLPQWKRGQLGQVLSIDDPTQCLTVGLAGEPNEFPPDGTELRLDTCEGGIGEEFILPSTPLLLPVTVPALSVGGLMLLGGLLGIIGIRRRRGRLT